MSHFAFLDTEWPDLIAEAKKAEALAYTDPRTSCFYARRTLELAVTWLYRSDPSLKLPYDDSLSSLIHAPEFRQLVDQALLTKAKLIKDLGNRAVHSARRIEAQDAVTADREFKVTGMLNNRGDGFIDYVLWGDDGKPLGLVEAKRTKRDPREGQQQA